MISLCYNLTLPRFLFTISYEYIDCSDNVMWLLDKMAIICLAQLIMIPRAHTKPHTVLNNQAKGNNKHSPKNYLTSVQATDMKNSDTNSESILKTFKFPDIEYPVAATPRPQQYYFQDFYDNQSPQRNIMPDKSNIKISSDLKSARNGTFNNLQKLFKPNMKNNSNKLKDLPDLQQQSGSDFRSVGNFPEVEYPLSAIETWKPNYWNIPSEGKDLNTLKAKISQLNQNLAKKFPTKKLGSNNKAGKCRSFSIKSYSDITKNKEQLKQVLENKANNTNRQHNSTCSNDFIINCEKDIASNDTKTLPIEKMVQELHTTATPYYLISMDVISDYDEYNIDLFNTFSAFNKSNQNNDYSSIPFQNNLIPTLIKTDNPIIDNNALNLEEISAILLNHNYGGQTDVCPNNVQEMDYDPYDILDVRKPETGSDLCGLEDDHTTDVYSEENNIGWFPCPSSTPPPFSPTTDNLMWKNCKILTPGEFNVDDLEDYYISV